MNYIIKMLMKLDAKIIHRSHSLNAKQCDKLFEQIGMLVSKSNNQKLVKSLQKAIQNYHLKPVSLYKKEIAKQTNKQAHQSNPFFPYNLKQLRQQSKQLRKFNVKYVTEFDNKFSPLNVTDITGLIYTLLGTIKRINPEFKNKINTFIKEV